MNIKLVYQNSVEKKDPGKRVKNDKFMQFILNLIHNKQRKFIFFFREIYYFRKYCF